MGYLLIAEIICMETGRTLRIARFTRQLQQDDHNYSNDPYILSQGELVLFQQGKLVSAAVAELAGA